MILGRCWIIKNTSTFNNLKVNDTIRYPLIIIYFPNHPAKTAFKRLASGKPGLYSLTDKQRIWEAR